MMKKVYGVGLLLIAASLAGCSFKVTMAPTASTGNAQEVTGTTTPTTTTTTTTIPNIPSSAMEEYTGSIDSGVVPVVSGSEGVNVNSGVTADVQALINERKTQSGDTTKLTEEDISLMEKVIQKVQTLGK